MIFPVYCDLDGCHKNSHCYDVTIPNLNRKFCKECGRALGGITITYTFCGPEHALEWLQNYIRSCKERVKEE